MLNLVKFLRIPALALFLMTPMLISGCGGDGSETGPELTPAEDTALDPATDSTMNPDAGSGAQVPVTK